MTENNAFRGQEELDDLPEEVTDVGNQVDILRRYHEEVLEKLELSKRENEELTKTTSGLRRSLLSAEKLTNGASERYFGRVNEIIELKEKLNKLEGESAQRMEESRSLSLKLSKLHDLERWIIKEAESAKSEIEHASSDLDRYFESLKEYQVLETLRQKFEEKISERAKLELLADLHSEYDSEFQEREIKKRSLTSVSAQKKSSIVSLSASLPDYDKAIAELSVQKSELASKLVDESEKHVKLQMLIESNRKLAKLSVPELNLRISDLQHSIIGKRAEYKKLKIQMA